METTSEAQNLLVPIGYMVSVIGALVSAIGILFWQLQSQGTVWRKESKENTAKMTQVVTENNHAIQALTKSVENNTKSTDKMFEHLSKK